MSDDNSRRDGADHGRPRHDADDQADEVYGEQLHERRERTEQFKSREGDDSGDTRLSEHDHPGAGHTNVIEVVAAAHAEDIDPRKERAGELLIAAMLAGAGVLAILFTVVYFAVDDTSPYQTPLFGLTMGGMLLLLGAVPIMYVKYLVPGHLLEATQDRHEMYSSRQDADDFKADFGEATAVTGLGRRTAIKLAGGFAGTVALLPAVVPLLSLGRWQHKERALATTPFGNKPPAGAPGIRLVTESLDGFRFIKPGDIPEGGLLTVLPEGHTDSADAPAILIRMRPGTDQPTKGREDYAWQGAYVAYSAICTHAGCPVKLYEQQTHHLLCPCHQSTFLANEGCRVIFGPAARPLPQLPITVDEEGYFVATGDFSDPIGPSYWERDA